MSVKLWYLNLSLRLTKRFDLRCICKSLNLAIFDQIFLRLSIVIHEIIFPSAQDVSKQVEWTFYDLFSILYFFFYALYSTSCYILLCRNTTTVRFIKESSFFLCFINTFDRDSLLSFHSDPIYVSLTIHVST